MTRPPLFLLNMFLFYTILLPSSLIYLILSPHHHHIIYNQYTFIIPVHVQNTSYTFLLILYYIDSLPLASGMNIENS